VVYTSQKKKLFNDKLELFSHIIVKTNPFVYSAAFDVNCDVILL